jgi:sugar O-acyltransferase (sialic acid O-acetyltransferase NeuD family)
VKEGSILLLGAGGHARACIDVLEMAGQFRIGGLLGLRAEVGSSVLGYPVLGTDTDLTRLLCEHGSALIAVGQIKTPEPRMRLFDLARAHDCALPVIVSPRAHLSKHASVAAGTIVMHGAVVNAGATVGRNCILNSLSLIEHDVVIEDHCHIATGAVINSGVRVGAGTFIGSNSCVRQGLHIGERCVIGMGQRVVHSCTEGTRLPQWGLPE